MKRRIIIFTISVLLLASLAVPVRADRFSQTGVSIYVDGPSEVFVNHTEHFFVEVRGSFAEEALNWSINVEDVPDGLHIEPLSDESTTSSIFQINVTAVEKGSYSFRVVGYCSDGLEIRYRESTLDIDAYKPIITRVDLTNPKEYDLDKVIVGLFIGDELFVTQTVDRLEANETRMIEFMWGKEKLEEGEHTIEIWADYGFRPGEDFNKGELLLSKTFYVEGEPGPWQYALPIIMVIAGVLFVLYYLKRRKKRRRPW